MARVTKEGRPYYTGPEICARYDISRPTIASWVENYGLPAVKVGGRWRLDKHKAAQWEAVNNIEPIITDAA